MDVEQRARFEEWITKVYPDRDLEKWPDCKYAYSFAALAWEVWQAALTPPEGHVVVTRDEDGEIVMVSRQNDDHEVLEVIALTTHAGGKPCEYTPPDGYVLVPVEPTEEMVLAAKLFQGDNDNVDNWMEWEGVAAANQYKAMLAARPEVKP